jgi:hypothetical protein
MVNPFAAANSLRNGWEIAQITVNSLNIETVERRIVAPVPKERANYMSVTEQAPHEIGSEMTAGSRYQ